MKIREGPAFTLIELMITVVILAILATIALPRYTLMVERARAQEAIVNLNLIYAGQKMYHQDNDTYTPTLDDLREYVEITPRYFDYAITAATVDAFTATATRNSGQQEGDVYSINETGILTPP